MNLRKIIHSAAHRLERRLDALRLRVKRRLGWLGPIQIMPFLGYGNLSAVHLGGRVLEEKDLGDPHRDSPWWENLKAMYYRIESDEIPHVGVRAHYNGQVYETRTDDEGYFAFELHAGEAHSGDWHDVSLELSEAVVPSQGAVTATGQVLIPPGGADYAVVSDIDDTILQTYATDFLRMMRVTFLNNAHTRMPFEGVAAFYEALRKGPGGNSNNPIFYVSSSSWNLYDLLLAFLNIHEIPRGPLLLRDLGLDRNKFIKTGHEHKLEKVERLLRFYPDTPFILIGDSGQDDPMLYCEAVKRHPGRVLAVYIRDVHPSNRSKVSRIAQQVRAMGSDMQLVRDTEAAARHAAEQDLIAQGAVAEVSRQKMMMT